MLCWLVYSSLSAPLVKFTPLSEMDRNKFVEVGNPIVLYCELSDPEAPVRWYKNGVELQSMEGLHIQSEGTMRRIVIQSADFSHSGVYSCDAIDDVIRFNVEVEGESFLFLFLLSSKMLISFIKLTCMKFKNEGIKESCTCKPLKFTK